MKAAITTSYGPSTVLNIVDIQKPQIGDDEILVEVKAASINPLDWKIRRGELKMMTGKTAPKILGSDYAGIVSAIGKDFQGYKIGDEVYGMIDGMKIKEGSHAQFIKVKEQDICLKPSNMDFEEAASIPLVGLTAHLALTNVIRVKSGDHILINGCTGGVGSIAVEIAKSLGCEVSGVCSTSNIKFAKALGVDHIIDYKSENVISKATTYDAIFDTVGSLSFSKIKTIIKSGGTFATTAVTIPAMLFWSFLNLFRGKKSKLVVNAPSSKTLNTLKSLVENSHVQSHIAKTFRLEEIREAHDLSERGGFTGKLVIKM